MQCKSGTDKIVTTYPQAVGKPNSLEPVTQYLYSKVKLLLGAFGHFSLTS